MEHKTSKCREIRLRVHEHIIMLTHVIRYLVSFCRIGQVLTREPRVLNCFSKWISIFNSGEVIRAMEHVVRISSNEICAVTRDICLSLETMRKRLSGHVLEAQL